MTMSAALNRLDRLESYLLTDSDNPILLADAFDTALQASEWSRAEVHLRRAQAIGLDRHSWALREAHWMMAQRRWVDAVQRLRSIESEESDQTPSGLAAAVAHDIAFCSLQANEIEVGLATLGPWMESHDGDSAAYQVLWLRLLHRAYRLEQAMQWAGDRAATGQLAPVATGVASLIALDQADFARSLEWSNAALQEDAGQMEALIARGSVALAQRNTPEAIHFLERALQRNDNDGRSWSALAFARLLAQDLSAARADFDRALALMPGHVGTWHGLGWTAILQHDLPAADKAFESALALDRNFGESHGGRAVVMALMGLREEARESIVRAERLDRQNLSSRYAQALLDGNGQDLASLRRMAHRMLNSRAAPFGGNMFSALPFAEDGDDRA